MESEPLTVIRELDPSSGREVELVAVRMRETLIEVLGEQRGSTFYTMDWLRDRVLWHLDARNAEAKIFLSEDGHGRITGQAIARVEKGDHGSYGYFSTIYVEPAARKRGVATSLLQRIEAWLREKGMPRIVYNTAETNDRLIRLFGRHGYTVTHRNCDMVQLTKALAAESSARADNASLSPSSLIN